jgi:hypothetical protein
MADKLTSGRAEMLSLQQAEKVAVIVREKQTL